jgi:ubiquinone/menaquinone biosynthesis C-methylase UbiE
MGTYFRSELFKKLKVETSLNDKVLDVGCFDGYWLSTQKAKEKVGLDIDIQKKYKNIKYVKGSALDMPFKNDYFDKVFAFDVIEHIPANTEQRFLRELIRVTKKDGSIIFTVPSENIKIFPSFLTNYVSKKWGHNKYNGLSKFIINSLLKKNLNIKYEIFDLNTKFYLNYYLLLRIFWLLNPKKTMVLLGQIIKKDITNHKGENGYFLIKIYKK